MLFDWTLKSVDMTVKLIVIIVAVGLISNSFCDDIVKRLKYRYNNAVGKCLNSHKKEKPAYECSGILIRGVNYNLKMKFAWDMKELNKQKEAFSVSYLRRDQVFSSFPRNYDSGFIIYPHLKTPRIKNTYKVLCSFPLDADTDLREGYGCGRSKGDTTQKSSHCDKQNIKSLDKWISHYNNIMSSRYKNFVARQCAFEMTTKSATKYFVISLQANKYIQSHSNLYSYRNNDIRMHAWNAEKAEKLPIEAFFYLLGSARGKYLAEKYQDQFYQKGGGEVPIVGIRLPTLTKSFEVILHKRKPRKE